MREREHISAGVVCRRRPVSCVWLCMHPVYPAAPAVLTTSLPHVAVVFTCVVCLCQRGLSPCVPGAPSGLTPCCLRWTAAHASQSNKHSRGFAGWCVLWVGLSKPPAHALIMVAPAGCLVFPAPWLGRRACVVSRGPEMAGVCSLISSACLLVPGCDCVGRVPCIARGSTVVLVQVLGQQRAAAGEGA